MPKRIPEEEFNAILGIVAGHHPNAVQVRTIREGLPYALPPRMLQRRLALLVEQRRLVAEGRGKGRRYRVPVTITGKGNLVADRATVAARGEVYVPISPEAEAIKDAVRAPIQHRQPVGYQRAFLDEYRPNETFFFWRTRVGACSRWGARLMLNARPGPMHAGSTAAC
ncbi:hypothetical protein U5801_14575 [Lamprobacter modestohalophilus]|uniref:hypothetical protein n=1 Tax=Lamprobacter modestohalophilus TaxID=1064514 RepID=UPI002ADEABB7|nr:hypothetical protein [Lamprobacter modestohalophilus]MEA1051024.1 hypothetical protein [Lamprobacter modestohalophilus]